VHITVKYCLNDKNMLQCTELAHKSSFIQSSLRFI